MPKSQYTREEVIEKVRKGESLEGADLSLIDLSGIDFRNANLKNAIFMDADLKDAKFNREQVIEMIGNGESLKGADLSGIDFSDDLLLPPDIRAITRTNLSDADFRKANLKGADLSDTNLCRANFTGADFEDANLKHANLKDANLTRAILRGADLRYANLMGAKLGAANCYGAKFNGADLLGANLMDAKLNRADLTGADLTETKLENADLTDAIIYDANIFRINKDYWIEIVIMIKYPTQVYDYDSLKKSRKDPIVFNNPKDFEKYLNQKSVRRSAVIYANEGYTKTERCKEIARNYAKNCYSSACTCYHFQIAKYLFEKFNYGTFTEDILPNELLKSLLKKKIIIELKRGHVDKKKSKEKKSFCFNGSIKNKEDLIDRLSMKCIGDMWCVSRDSFQNEDDLYLLIDQEVINEEESDSDYLYFDMVDIDIAEFNERLDEIEVKCEVFYGRDQILFLWLLSKHIGKILSLWQQYHKRKPPFEDIERPKETRWDYISKDILIKIIREFFRDKGWGNMVYDPRNKQTELLTAPCPFPEHNQTTSA